MIIKKPIIYKLQLFSLRNQGININEFEILTISELL